MQKIHLETTRTIIRDHCINDLASHHKLFSDAEVMYYLQDIKTVTLEESEKNLLNSMDEIGKINRTKYFFRVEEKGTLAHIGEVGYTVTDVTPIGKHVGLGYFINKEFWNQGFVTEIVREVIRFAFEDDNVFRITTGCIKNNIGSERVMQKCGMIKEGELKKCEWHMGEIKDRVTYRLLKEDWIV